MKFEKNQKVIIKGYSGTWEVHQGVPDRDNEISIWDDAKHSGWFYVEADKVSPVGRPVKSLGTPKVTPEAELFTLNEPIELPEGWGIPLPKEKPNFNSNTEVSKNMSNRNVVTVTLIDQDAGLKPELALVKSFGTQVADGSHADLQMKLVMDNDMAAILAKHNAKRVKEIDLDIRQRTGNEVNLQPVELNQLKWVIVTH